MRRVLQSVATVIFLSGAPFATAQNPNANDTANLGADNANGRNPTSAPEIRTVAAGAVGILVVGGIALLTTRRRAHATKI
jgi:hypothetical protein